MPFQFNGATISARELTIKEDADLVIIARQLDPDVKIMHLWFAEYELSAEVSGKEPISRIGVTSSTDAIRSAYAEWEKLPRRFRTQWRVELERVEGGEDAEGKASASSS